MKRLNQIRVLTTFGVIAAWAASCAPAQTSKIVITFPKSKGISANAEIMASPSPGMGGNNGFANPTSLDSFQCFGINVTGPGIPDDLRLSGCDQAAQKPASPDNPRPGVMGGLASTNGGSIELKVPAGDNRVVQLIGVQTSGGCPSIDDIAKASLKRRQEDQARMQAMQGQPQPGASGMPNQGGGDFAINGIKMGEPYELGRAVTNIRGDTTVSIKAAFDASNPKRVFNNDQCSSGGGQNGVQGGSGPMGPPPMNFKKFLYTADGGNIRIVDLNGQPPALTSPQAVAISTGASIIDGLYVDKDGKMLFVLTGSGSPMNVIKTYTINQTTGALTAGSTSSANQTTGGHFAVTPDGGTIFTVPSTYVVKSFSVDSAGAITAGTTATYGYVISSIEIDAMMNRVLVMHGSGTYYVHANNYAGTTLSAAVNGTSYSGTTPGQTYFFSVPGGGSLFNVSSGPTNLHKIALDSNGAPTGVTAATTLTMDSSGSIRVASSRDGKMVAVLYKHSDTNFYVALYERDSAGNWVFRAQTPTPVSSVSPGADSVFFDPTGTRIYVGIPSSNTLLKVLNVAFPPAPWGLSQENSVDLNDAGHWNGSAGYALYHRKAALAAIPQP